MDDNKKFSIREYRETLYSHLRRKRKEQKRRVQKKYLESLGLDAPLDCTLPADRSDASHRILDEL